MSTDATLLHLTDADIGRLDLGLAGVRGAIDKAFLAHSRGLLRTEPKTSMFIGPGHAFQSLIAVDTQGGFAALKWVGMVPPGGAADVNINASILLSDAASGRLLCLMDGRRATALRTAGMTAVAAQYLARKDSASIGFVGAGVQAHSHLLALKELLPSLRTVHIHSKTAASGERLADSARALGFEARVTGARDVLQQSDIVITTVPLGPDFEPFIEAAWIRPGAFVAAIDVARSWKHEGLRDLELTVVDDEAMKHYAKPGNFIPELDHADATLSDLVGKGHPGRVDSRQRAMLFSSGSAVADLAIATLIYERAINTGIGTRLAN
ncbi:ornithine cyclodeaminase family protein [Caenimonas aquaedulcis]|uniref:Ornithine cyclodeaminase family protein n=1 Tax=Caenimonas aquaedulcis TaxID=2793270 RepID=A0A931H3U1_9BURK|nr:ornithine cyclodeaminase family protein [Caenimonas aquaedulcis]MBG9387975.1 ornithine cyclodeaminase family protein [Caenimonas aquaedulcis]